MTQQLITLGLSGNRFLFKADGNFSDIPNVTLYKTKDDGAYWGFDALYPQAAVTFAHLKAVANVTAVGMAANVARKIVGVPDAISSFGLIDDNHDLFKVSPYAHQASAIIRMMHYDRLAILFEQGLGKTYIALMYQALRRRVDGQDYKMLAVAPKIVAPNWLREAQKYTGLRGVLLLGDQKKRGKIKEQLEGGEWDFIITTYDVLGNAQSNKKNMRGSKEAKIDCWLGTNPGHRRVVVTGAQRKNILTQEEAEYLLRAQATSTKERAELWKTLTKISKQLQNQDLVKYQNNYSDLEFLKDQPYDIVVFDEASRIKNRKSARTVAASALAEKARWRYHLSGTLCNGDPTDLYAPFTILNNRLWNDFQSFEKKYVVYSPYNKHIVLRYENLDDLKKRTDPYKFEAKRQECISQPPRLMQRIEVPLDESLVDLYNAIADTDNATITVNGYIINVNSPVVKLSKLSQLMSGFIYPTMGVEHFEWCNTCQNVVSCLNKDLMPWHEDCVRRDEHKILKAPKLAPLIFGDQRLQALRDDLEDSDEKTIIWSWFGPDKERIAALLHRMRIPFITADTPGCDAIFEADDKIRVFLGQTSQGIGITLNSATRTIYYSHGLALEPRLQSLDRNYRIGQEKKVIVRDYVDSDSMEADVLDLLDHKVDVKTFLQRNLECFACRKRLQCQEEKITIYSEQCIFEFELREAERKATIPIRMYGTLVSDYDNKRGKDDKPPTGSVFTIPVID